MIQYRRKPISPSCFLNLAAALFLKAVHSAGFFIFSLYSINQQPTAYTSTQLTFKKKKKQAFESKIILALCRFDLLPFVLYLK